MKKKKLIVYIEYTEEGKTFEQILEESFQNYLNRIVTSTDTLMISEG